mgnify:CR=1 FL=1
MMKSRVKRCLMVGLFLIQKSEIIECVAPADSLGRYGGRSQPKHGLWPRFKADNPRLWSAPQD